MKKGKQHTEKRESSMKGESPKDVLASMPEKDFDKVSEVVGNLKATNLTRQQRRRIEREFKTVRR
nr:hypothetical protein [Parabacteroides distasonis]